ncbi:galectin-8-like [Periplaneta americana]|uniref:galectin-8-like n=1 Tax=Periplaneta americana TaxID=6978 RepID=UPI0037E95F05
MSQEVKEYDLKKIVIGTLPMPLVVGSVIEVNGEVLVQTIRFSLTLTCGPGLLDDLALYFSPRFDQNIVIRNSRLRGHWGEEECTAPVRNPFRNGAKFQVMILSTATEFMVAVNGIHFCAYRFRTLPGKVETIQVHGNVLTEAIAYGMVGYYPVLREGLADPVITLSPLRPLSEIFSDVVSTPITAILSSGFVPENELEIVGRVKILPISFSIKLQTSVNTWPSPDILLDISPIFRNGSGYTIMNSFSRGKWRRGSKKPLYFMPGRPFSIKIAAQQDEYIVKVDGVNLASYKYMHNPRKVKCLKIEGDVKIKEINIT